MIQPTIGRIVIFKEGSRELPAIITAVHSDRCINVTLFGGPNGPAEDFSSMTLRQPEDEAPPDLCYCEWMPYQTKKDFGSESGEKAAGKTNI